MWPAARRLLDKLSRSSAPPCVYVGARVFEPDGIVIEVPLGQQAVAPQADARLAMGPNPRQVREVVRYCARCKLPVDTWLITEVWQMPARPDQIARWLYELATDGPRAALWIDADLGRRDCRGGRGVPPGFVRRLVGHLRRLGCEVVLS